MSDAVTNLTPTRAVSIEDIKRVWCSLAVMGSREISSRLPTRLYTLFFNLADESGAVDRPPREIAKIVGSSTELVAKALGQLADLEVLVPVPRQEGSRRLTHIKDIKYATVGFKRSMVELLRPTYMPIEAWVYLLREIEDDQERAAWAEKNITAEDLSYVDYSYDRSVKGVPLRSSGDPKPGSGENGGDASTATDVSVITNVAEGAYVSQFSTATYVPPAPPKSQALTTAQNFVQGPQAATTHIRTSSYMGGSSSTKVNLLRRFTADTAPAVANETDRPSVDEGYFQVGGVSISLSKLISAGLATPMNFEKDLELPAALVQTRPPSVDSRQSVQANPPAPMTVSSPSRNIRDIKNNPDFIVKNARLERSSKKSKLSQFAGLPPKVDKKDPIAEALCLDGVSKWGRGRLMKFVRATCVQNRIGCWTDSYAWRQKPHPAKQKLFNEFLDLLGTYKIDTVEKQVEFFSNLLGHWPEFIQQLPPYMQKSSLFHPTILMNAWDKISHIVLTHGGVLDASSSKRSVNDMKQPGYTGGLAVDQERERATSDAAAAKALKGIRAALKELFVAVPATITDAELRPLIPFFTKTFTETTLRALSLGRMYIHPIHDIVENHKLTRKSN